MVITLRISLGFFPLGFLSLRDNVFFARRTLNFSGSAFVFIVVIGTHFILNHLFPCNATTLILRSRRRRLRRRCRQMQRFKNGFRDHVTVTDGKNAVSLAADSALEPVVVDSAKQQDDFALFQTHLDPGLRVELVLGDGLAFREEMLGFPVAQRDGGGGR